MKALIVSALLAATVATASLDLPFGLGRDLHHNNHRAGGNQMARRNRRVGGPNEHNVAPPVKYSRSAFDDGNKNTMEQNSLIKAKAINEMATAANAGEYKYAVNLVPSFPFNTTAGGGATLHADATYPTPNPANPTEKFPLVLFPNSWGIPEIEYILKILNISTTGYVCVEYQTRGWWASSGEINTAGPFDRSDGSELIDHILNNYGAAWNIDSSKIAFGGISYGAGISLMMAGYDPRVKTAVALSGWGNLTDSMYQYNSPSLSSLHTLLSSAKAVGKPSADLIAMQAELLEHQNMSTVISFGEQRSARAYLPSYKSWNKPIFMSNNYLDRFFHPQGNANFWSEIDVTNKFLLLNNGGHAIAEVLGIANIQDYVWTKGQMWLDAILKGIDNGILTEPRVQMQHGNSIFSYDYLMYDNVPSPYVSMSLTPRSGADIVGGLEKVSMFKADQQKKVTTAAASKKKQEKAEAIENGFRSLVADDLITDDMSMEQIRSVVAAHKDRFVAKPNMQPRKKEAMMKAQSALNINSKGNLGACSPTAAAVDRSSIGASNSINFSVNVTLNRGNDMKRVFGIMDTYQLNTVDPTTTLVFTSEPLAQDSLLCGFPELRNINVIPTVRSTGAPSPNFQVYVYLYDVDSACTGDVISDGQYTKWYDTSLPAYTSAATGAQGYTIPTVEMRGTCKTIPAGNRVALGVVLYSENFTPSTQDVSVTFDYSANPTLNLPLA